MAKKNKQVEDEELTQAEADQEPASDPLVAVERERDELLVNWQRARADFQNLKRRTLEDIEAAVSRERLCSHGQRRAAASAWGVEVASYRAAGRNSPLAPR